MKIYKISLILAVALTLIYAFQGFYPEFISFFSNVFPPFLSGAAAISSILAFLKYGRRNLRQRFSQVWLCFSFGMVLWFLGETGWAVYTLILGVEIPYPSMADIFWLGGYVPLFIALCLYVSTFKSTLSKRTLSTTFITILVLSVLVSATLVTPLVAAEENSVTLLVDLAYPLLDLILLSAAILGFSVFLKGKLGRSWLLINAGILSNVAADMLFSYTTAQGTYINGHPLELLFLWGYTFFILAFYVHKKEL